MDNKIDRKSHRQTVEASLDDVELIGLGEEKVVAMVISEGGGAV